MEFDLKEEPMLISVNRNNCFAFALESEALTKSAEACAKDPTEQKAAIGLLNALKNMHPPGSVLWGANGLQRSYMQQVEISSDTHALSVAKNGTYVFSCINDSWLQLAGDSVPQLQTMKGALHLGAAIILYAIIKTRSRPLFSVLGIVSWLTKSDFIVDVQARRASVKGVLWNNMANLPTQRSLATQLQLAPPFFAFPTPGSAEFDGEEQLFAFCEQLLSLVLRWHVVSNGKIESSSSEKLSLFARATASPSLDRQEKEKEKTRVLTLRSFKFFGWVSAADSLLQDPRLFRALAWLMRAFRSKRASIFFVGQLTEIFAHTVRHLVVKKHGRLAQMKFLRDFLGTLVPLVDNSRAEALRQSKKGAEKTKAENRAEQARKEALLYRLRNEQNELCDLQVDTAHACVTKKMLTPEEAAYLCKCEADESFVVSLDFFASQSIATLALAHDMERERPVIKSGRCYHGPDFVLNACDSLLSGLLTQYAQGAGKIAKLDNAFAAQLMQDFSDAIPNGAGFYAEDRPERFDDVGLGSSEIKAIYTDLDGSQFALFNSKKLHKLSLPNEFSAPGSRGLLRNQEQLRATVRLPHTLHCSATGPVVVGQLALSSIMHTEKCHRTHLKISYCDDKVDREKTYAELRNQLTSSSSMQAIETLGDRVRLITSTSNQANNNNNNNGSSADSSSNSSGIRTKKKKKQTYAKKKTRDWPK